MTDYKDFLLKLNQNLTILQEREAKYSGNAPLELLNQIADHRQAITLTEQAIRGEVSEAEWRTTLKPLLLAIDSRSGDSEAASSVTIGDIEGGIHNSKIAGRDIIENIFHIVNQTIPRPVLIVIGVAVVTLVILGIVNLQPVSVALFPTPTPTITPLPFEPAKENETLILIATFHHTEGVADTDAHNEIRRAIEAAVAELGVKNLRVEVEPTRLTGDDQDEARKLGERYGASMVIWGSDTGVRVMVNFLNLKEPDYEAAEVKISETERTQLANPSAYARFITTDLPSQLTFLALYAIGISYFIQDDYPEAIYVIEKALKVLPPEVTRPQGMIEAYFALGLLYQVQGQNSQALVHYAEVIKLEPEYEADYDIRKKAFNNRGIAYYDQGNYLMAIADYNKAIELDLNYAPTYNNRGNTYSKLGVYEWAITDYNKAIELDPNLAVAYANRGTAYTEQGDYQRAITDCNKAIELDPKDVYAYLCQGLTYYDRGDYERTIADYNKAIELDPNLAAAHVNRGGVYIEQGDYQRAFADYNKAIELDPKYADAYYGRGLAYTKQRDYQQAIADFTKAIELNPSQAIYWNNLCRAGTLSGASAKVIQACDRAVKLDPLHGGNRNNRGVTRAIIGDYQGAIEDFKFFIEWMKKNGLYKKFEQIVRKREVWIAALEAGRNPFDEATLEELRKEWGY